MHLEGLLWTPYHTTSAPICLFPHCGWPITFVSQCTQTVWLLTQLLTQQLRGWWYIHTSCDWSCTMERIHLHSGNLEGCLEPLRYDLHPYPTCLVAKGHGKGQHFLCRATRFCTLLSFKVVFDSKIIGKSTKWNFGDSASWADFVHHIEVCHMRSLV